MLKPNIVFIENFIDNTNGLVDEICQTVAWHENFSARKLPVLGWHINTRA